MPDEPVVSGSHIEKQFDYAWKWFAYHADQRIKMFNYMVVALGLFTTGICTMIAKDQRFGAIALCFTAGVLAILFAQIDRRNQRLVQLGEDMLGHLENEWLFPAIANKTFEAHSERPNTVGYAILPREWQNDGVDTRGTRLWKEIRGGKHRLYLRVITYLMVILFFVGGVALLCFPEIQTKTTDSRTQQPAKQSTVFGNNYLFP